MARPVGSKNKGKPRLVPAHCMFLTAHGYCREAAGHGDFLNFCEEHAHRLAEIRAAMQAELAATSRYHRDGEWAGRASTPRPKRPSTCCNPYCSNTRTPPAAFCDDCLEAGYVEEVA